MEQNMEQHPAGKGWRETLRPYLPKPVFSALQTLQDTAPIEEIRLRAGQPIHVCLSDGERLLPMTDGQLAVTAELCEETLRRICDHSLYAWAEEIKHGFLSLAGGYRVGITGRVVYENGQLARLTDVTGLCIRIGRSCIGSAARLIPYLADADGLLRTTLIVSAPCAGKTTLLRDLIRSASCGEAGLKPCCVGVVDTRYELAGCVRGVPQFDLGPRTDVLSGSGKAEGLRMLLRTMSPRILAADELAAEDEFAAVTEAAACGVRVLASVHSGSAAMLQRRGMLRPLLGSGLFERFVVLSRRCGPGTVEGVYDAALQPLERRRAAC